MEFLIREARRIGLAQLWPVGAVTQGQEGAQLTEFGQLRKGGAVALSDDGAPISSSMVMRRAEVLNVEAIVRGYITGSGWAEYQQTGSVCGNPLPAGLLKSMQLVEPIFTPSSSSPSGLSGHGSACRM